jgi:ribosome-binding factor A
MTSRRIRRKDLEGAAAEVGPDDGKDPRYDRPEQTRPPGKRKALQLCAEVARTLGEVLAGESGDEVLRDLVVESVTPAPSSARLLVVVALAPSAPDRDPGVVAARLEGARGRLRTEVAAAVRRRKAPDLVFQVQAR